MLIRAANRQGCKLATRSSFERDAAGTIVSATLTFKTGELDMMYICEGERNLRTERIEGTEKRKRDDRLQRNAESTESLECAMC